MKTVLLDTSCIVALFDRSERHHKLCVEEVSQGDITFITCEAVIAESAYLLRKYPRAITAMLSNITLGVFQIPFRINSFSQEVKTLMIKYRTVPMDIADACLVQMATTSKISTVLTLDSDFEIYRWSKNKRFDLPLL